MMNKYSYIISGLVVAVVLILISSVMAIDKQHGGSGNGKCVDCHTSTGALGPSKTKFLNENLCYACHVQGGQGGMDPGRVGSNKQFYRCDQANKVDDITCETHPTRFTSHSWDTFLPITHNPNNTDGLRAVYSCSTGNPLHNTSSACTAAGGTWIPMNSLLTRQLSKFGECRKNEGTGNILYCTTGNDAHNTRELCTAAGGTWVYSQATCETSANRTNFSARWKALGTCAVCHNVHYHSRQPWNPFAQTYVTYSGGETTLGAGDGRQFMRMDNQTNQMCEECHYWMKSGTTYAGTTPTNVKVYDGNKKSHPVNINLATIAANNPDEYFSVPVEPNWQPQTGTRYSANGTGDTNPTNNLVLDATGNIRCMTCHGIHYTDSNTSSVDGP